MPGELTNNLQGIFAAKLMTISVEIVYRAGMAQRMPETFAFVSGKGHEVAEVGV